MEIYERYEDIPKNRETATRWRSFGYRVKSGEDARAKVVINRKRDGQWSKDSAELFDFDQVQPIRGEKAAQRRDNFERFYYAGFVPDIEVYDEIEGIIVNAQTKGADKVQQAVYDFVIGYRIQANWQDVLEHFREKLLT
jgi:hypothetical protein